MTRTRFLYSVFIILIFNTTNLYGESYKVRRLLEKSRNTVDNDKKTEILIEIGNELKGSHPDSALGYFLQAERRTVAVREPQLREKMRCRIMLGKISIALAKGDYPEAVRLDSLALVIANRLGNNELKAQAVMSKGSIFYYQSRFEEAQRYNHQALKLIKTTGDRKTEGKILTNMGTVEFMFGNVNKADSLFRIPLRLAEQSGDDDLLAASYVNLGLLNYYRGLYDTAAADFRKAIIVYKGIAGKDGLVLCYENMANVGFGKGDLALAMEYTRLQSITAHEIGDRMGEAKALHNLGEIYLQLGDYEQALGSFLRSLTLKAAFNDKKELALTSLSIGQIHYRLANFSQAIDYFRKSLEANQKAGYQIGIGKDYEAIGNIMLEWKKNDSALFYFKKSAKIFNKTQAISLLSAVYLNIGRVYLEDKKFSEAESYYIAGRDISLKLEDKLQTFQSLLALAHLQLEQLKSAASGATIRKKLFSAALFNAKRAYEITDSAQILTGKKESAAILSEIYSIAGNASEVFRYTKIWMTTTDTLSKRQRAEALANAEILWKSEKKQAEINLLLSEKVLNEKVIEQKSKLNNRLSWLLGAVVVSIIFLIAFAIQYYRNREKQKVVDYQKFLNEVTILRLQNLSNRLSPHLLFNVLNSLTVDHSSLENNRLRISRITSLLRLSLENAEKIAIPLSSELKMIWAYVDLQRDKIPQPFFFDVTIHESVDAEQLIPAMLIQIPVENAIKHGLMPIEGDKRLTIEIYSDGKSTNITIADNGTGRSKAQKRTTGTGTGLKVLFQTIHLLNQKNNHPITIQITDSEPTGTAVNIKIPANYNFQR
jgi:tetratricopeptide (TPR) repeat protein